MKGQESIEAAPAASEPAKDGLTATISTKGDKATPDKDPDKKRVRFEDEPPALSTEENKAIKDFSKAFGLDEERIGKILKDSKTPEGIETVDKAYLIGKGEENKNFKESSFFKGLFPENDTKKEGGGPQVQGVLGGNDLDEALRRKLANGVEGKGGEGKGGDNKKLMLALGLLFIACVLLATGGAALPLIGGFLASSQGLFIAGAVGAGLVGAGLFIKDQIGQGNNNQGGMKMVEGPGPIPKFSQGAQGQAQGQAPEKAPALLPDLMQLMKEDLQPQIEKDLRGFKKELDNNPKFSNIGKNISDDTYSKPYEPTSTALFSGDLEKLSALQDDIKDKLSKVGAERPDELTKKLPQAEPKDIGEDSKSQSQVIEGLNLKMPNTRPDSSSQSWVERMSEARGPLSSVREV